MLKSQFTGGGEWIIGLTLKVKLDVEILASKMCQEKMTHQKPKDIDLIEKRLRNC
jgi:hypothetical protein